jgi:hypothetical protein
LEFCQRYPHIAVDPDLFALVGIHPEHPVEEDKTLIGEQISRRLAGRRSWLTSMSSSFQGARLGIARPFGDNIQLASAEAISADHVITRNKTHFQPTKISILTPEEWLAVATVAKIEADL